MKTCADGPCKFMPTKDRHEHDMHMIVLTSEGPLRIVMACGLCAKTETIIPSSRKRKIPAGFTPEDWEEAVAEQKRRSA